MMFLLRSAFWLVVLILLIPTDDAQQKQIYGTAQSAMNDLSSFCDRNPQTCASGHYAFNTLVRKAQYGADMIMALVEQHSGSFDATHAAAVALPSNQAAQSAPVAMPSHDAAQSAPVAIPSNDSIMPVPSAVPLEPMPWEQSTSQSTLSPQDLETNWGGPSI